MIHFSRSDYVNEMDNEALDFEQLEAFIHNNTPHVQTSPDQPPTALPTNSEHLMPNQTNLPESPPDSGSEPPYSPSSALHKISSLAAANSIRNHHQHMQQDIQDHQNIQSIQNNQMDHLHLNLNTLTELHVPHHLLSNPPDIYLPNEHHQQLLHINNLLHKHDPSILSHEDQMLLYQVNGGQIIEMNHLQDPQMSQRLYKNEIQMHPLPAIQEIQQRLGNQENLQMLPDSYRSTMQSTQELPNHSLSVANPVISTLGTSTKKRKITAQTFMEQATAGEEIKFIKTEKQSGSTKSKKKQLLASLNDSTDEISSKEEKKKDKKAAKEQFCEQNENKSSNHNFMEAILASKNEDSTSSTLDSSQIQCIKFSSFLQHQWNILCDHNQQELTIPHFRVDADKGFNFSNSDDAFVCQKKNHFQITAHVQLHGNGSFVKTPTGMEKIRTFHLHFYGVKLEAPAQTIRVEQSQSDRSKKPFFPVLIDLTNGQVGKVTVGRLHFSETTCNNMRKKGRPNPEQRYFQLVVGLHAHTYSGYYPIISHASERIIVRASNPGQFDSDIDLCCWQRGITQNSIFHQGRIGINMDHPDESLVVSGNLKISGHIIQPSDRRVKKDIQEVNTQEQLDNINQLNIVKFRYDSNFAEYNEINTSYLETGIIAQDLQKVLPEAVHDGGNLKLANGVHIDNFLQINKDRIYMENVGAVKQLSKITDNLEKRIETLEKRRLGNRYLDRIKILQFFMLLMVFLTALWF